VGGSTHRAALGRPSPVPWPGLGSAPCGARGKTCGSPCSPPYRPRPS